VLEEYWSFQKTKKKKEKETKELDRQLDIFQYRRESS